MSIEWKYEPRKATGYAPDGQRETADNLAAIAERLTWLCERFEREDAKDAWPCPQCGSATSRLHETDCPVVAHLPKPMMPVFSAPCPVCYTVGANHFTGCSRLPAKEEPRCPSD